MIIQCECGKFQARLEAFPKNTPGRLVCYCDDCQKYLRVLNRTDLLDENGGTEVIPSYPSDVEIVKGADVLKCTRLSPRGTLRFSTVCCNTPIGNTSAGKPWIGFFRNVYRFNDTIELTEILGTVRSRIMGKYAQGTPPEGTPATFDLGAVYAVIPFIVKGKLLGKSKPSPFLKADGETPIVEPVLAPRDG